MGWFKEIKKAFTMSTEELIADSNRKIAESIKEKEGLNYIELLHSYNVFGLKGADKDTRVSIFDDRLRFSILSNTKRDIMFTDIKSVEILTDTQIEEKSKIGQMMIIGVFALATKKKTEEVVKTRLVLNVCEEGINFSVIIDTIHDALDEAKKLNRRLLEYKETVKE